MCSRSSNLDAPCTDKNRLLEREVWSILPRVILAFLDRAIAMVCIDESPATICYQRFLHRTLINLWKSRSDSKGAGCCFLLPHIVKDTFPVCRVPQEQVLLYRRHRSFLEHLSTRCAHYALSLAQFFLRLPVFGQSEEIITLPEASIQLEVRIFLFYLSAMKKKIMSRFIRRYAKMRRNHVAYHLSWKGFGSHATQFFIFVSKHPKHNKRTLISAIGSDIMIVSITDAMYMSMVDRNMF